MKSFSKWTIEEVEDRFHIVLEKRSQALEQWMTVHTSPRAEEAQQLLALREKLEERVWDWNEEELKVYFIAPLLNLVDFDQQQYKPFLAREIRVEYEGESLCGTVDFVVAAGRRSPRRPYFFIHEYKKEHDASNDPLGQLMVAMVAGQQLNADSNPLYGAYVMGRYWHFVILQGVSYAVHTGFNATDEDIHQIFAVLCNTKEIIEALIQQNLK